jgi:hypothetical protein
MNEGTTNQPRKKSEEEEKRHSTMLRPRQGDKKGKRKASKMKKKRDAEKKEQKWEEARSGKDATSEAGRRRSVVVQHGREGARERKGREGRKMVTRSGRRSR